MEFILINNDSVIYQNKGEWYGTLKFLLSFRLFKPELCLENFKSLESWQYLIGYCVLIYTYKD